MVARELFFAGFSCLLVVVACVEKEPSPPLIASNERSCDDENPCTRDSQHGGICVHLYVRDGVACDDGDPYTVGEVCVLGACTMSAR